jgi:LmbE family N-acetylglucosaminyl deacetylase
MNTRPTDLVNRVDLARYTRVYLSPHLDDAALSCGGTIAASPDRALVITLCTAPPSETNFNAVAVEFHAEWGLAPDEVLRVRRAEDAEAMTILGVDYVYADWLDAIYRMPEAYHSRATLYRHPLSDDPLLPQVRDLLALLIAHAPQATIYVPLGVGHHVDHLAVFESAVAFPPDRLAFYEDINYALLPGAVEQRLAEIRRTDPCRRISGVWCILIPEENCGNRRLSQPDGGAVRRNCGNGSSNRCIPRDAGAGTRWVC